MLELKFMRKLFILYFLLNVNFVFAESANQIIAANNELVDSSATMIQLASSIQANRFGYWQNGSYTIYINIDTIVHMIKRDYKDLIRAREAYKTDTVNYARHTLYINRFFKAYNQLKTSRSTFDLKKIVVYIGPENKEQNRGNSGLIDLYLKRLVFAGNAIVYYKGRQIYTLQVSEQADSGTMFSSVTKIFYDSIENCIYTEQRWQQW